MKLRRWLSVFLMMGLILALSSLGAQADPYPYGPYHHPHGHAYGWDGPGPHHFDPHYRHWRAYGGPHNHYYVERRVYTGPPAVAYVAPVAPVMAIPYAAPQQPYYSQPQQYGPPGLHGQINYGF
jgi:hypothetical protein